VSDDGGAIVIRALRILADHLDGWTDGDERAFETLGAALDHAGISADDLQAVACVLRGLTAGAVDEDGDDLDPAPARQSHRVLSSEERAILSPEAWGYLLWLRRQGSLDAGQCERVLDLVSESGVRPVSIEHVREAAVRIAMTRHDPAAGDGSLDLSH
jgi:uncharacterized protein Smg (DUF494 family)